MKTKELVHEDVFELPNDKYCGLGGTPLMKRIKMRRLRQFILQQKARRTFNNIQEKDNEK
jgi:hypothetical protein